MIGLRKENRYLRLFPGTRIPWEVENDLLDFDYMGQVYSWGFDVPREGNEWAFDFAGDVDSSQNGFRVYEGFELTKDGNVFHIVNLTLTESMGRHTYRVKFSNVPGQLIENKDVLLPNLITEKIAVADGTFADVLQPYNTTGSSNMVFPYLHFYNQRPVSTGTINFPTGYIFIPAFKVNYILRLAAQAMGYTFADNYSGYGESISKLIIFNNRPIDTATSLITDGVTIGFDKVGNVIDVAKYLPRISLISLLKNVAAWVGASIYVDDAKGRIELRAIERDLNNDRYVDLTNKVDLENIRVKKYDYQKLGFALQLENDALLSEMPETLDGNYKGEYASEAAYSAASSGTATEGDYAWCKTENAYYKWVRYGVQPITLERYTDAVQPYNANQSGAKKVDLDLIPVSKDKYTYSEQEYDFVITDNGSGKVRISVFSGASTVLGTGYQVRFIENTGDRVYSDKYYQVTAVDPVDYVWIDIDLDFSIKTQVKKIIGRFAQNYYLPLIGHPIHYPEINMEAPDFTGRLAVWHGMQPTIDGLSTYAYASADAYAADGTKIGDMALRFHQEDNVPDVIYRDTETFLKHTRVVELLGWLTEKEIAEVNELKLIKAGGAFMYVRRMSSEIGDDERMATELEAYRK